MIKAIIFDWGGVLIKYPVEDILLFCANRLQTSVKELRRRYKNYNDKMQRGSIKEQCLWENICNELGKQLPTSSSLIYEAVKTIYSPNQQMFTYVVQLKKKGYKIGFLSNTEQPMMKFFQEQHYGLFDATVFSCEEGFRKPEKQIYEIILCKLGVKPHEAVLIDDTQEYVKGAQHCGMQGIECRNFEQVINDLALLDPRLGYP
jgi:putative hydrolase of the HAD superfamily